MNIDLQKYCNSLTEYSRYKTREVNLGDIPLGGNNPIRIQSMTTTDTMDTIATVEQTIRMIDAGCEYVRITAPSVNEAKNLDNIKNELKKKGYRVPLIADIHFTPNAAEVAARIVEKVRINPGNYADKKKFQQIEYTDQEYIKVIDRIREKFSPLVKICKDYGTAIRIGANHGSLSDRIMSRYGDTPLGMVESALEFVYICEELKYHDIVLSMKASNTQIMVQAYRLLIQKMNSLGMNYPIHLGVTEAGDGEDGRIKSAVGIAALLEDGIGDTIRVSLTEEPENEAPVASALVNRYKDRPGHQTIHPINDIPKDPFLYERRNTIEVSNIGGSTVPKVVADFSKIEIRSHSDLESVGYFYSSEIDKWNMNDQACDLLYMGQNDIYIDIPNSLKAIYDYNNWTQLEDRTKGYPLITFKELIEIEISSEIIFVEISIEDVFSDKIEILKKHDDVVLVVVTNNRHGMAEQRRIFYELLIRSIKNPVIIQRSYFDIDHNLFRLHSSTDLGSLLIDGFGDGVWSEYNSEETKNIELVNKTLFGILQATRVRISKTEYIACPSCGRTLFDLVEITNKIRKKTEHLKGVKIGIMGCIVNGPGEMADADYGYVGSGKGKITLYKGKEIVKRHIDSEYAVEELINLIKEGGDWIKPLN
jgi:(E)-4-hydroxy-3-methylbut-2-enyl-diphosphate synthase